MKGATTAHADHKFSITVQSDDLAVINCLRALSKYSQKTGNNNIPWGRTKDLDWEKKGHEVTFHFSDPRYREASFWKQRDYYPRVYGRRLVRTTTIPPGQLSKARILLLVFLCVPEHGYQRSSCKDI